MQEFKLNLRMPNGNKTGLIYRPYSSELLWADTGERVAIAHVGIDYDSKPPASTPNSSPHSTKPKAPPRAPATKTP